MSADKFRPLSRQGALLIALLVVAAWLATAAAAALAPFVFAAVAAYILAPLARALESRGAPPAAAAAAATAAMLALFVALPAALLPLIVSQLGEALADAARAAKAALESLAAARPDFAARIEAWQIDPFAAAGEIFGQADAQTAARAAQAAAFVFGRGADAIFLRFGFCFRRSAGVVLSVARPPPLGRDHSRPPAAALARAAFGARARMRRDAGRVFARAIARDARDGDFLRSRLVAARRALRGGFGLGRRRFDFYSVRGFRGGFRAFDARVRAAFWLGLAARRGGGGDAGRDGRRKRVAVAAAGRRARGVGADWGFVVAFGFRRAARIFGDAHRVAAGGGGENGGAPFRRMESKHRLALDARLLAVDFERRRPAFADFAARGNDEAVAAVRALAGGDGAAAGAHLWGDGGCGKTHLLYAAAAAAARARGGFVAVFDSQTTKPPPAPRPGFVAVDNLESLATDGEAQTALFAWLNRARQAGDAFVLTASRRAPSEIGLRADLTTRVLAGLVFRLRAGDDETKRMALRARAKRLGYDLPGEVADLFLARLPRDMASLARAMDALDARLLQTRAPLSKKTATAFLAAYAPAHSPSSAAAARASI